MLKEIRYSRPQALLHWLSALIIIWALVSGFYVSLFDISTTTKDLVGWVNVSLTTLYIPFFILRLYFLFAHGCPKLSTHSWLTHCLAKGMHLSLYGVVALVLLTGVLMMDRPINIFDAVSIAQPPVSPEWTQRFHDLHIQACVVLAILVVLHIAAVIKHEVSGARVIKRMSL